MFVRGAGSYIRLSHVSGGAYSRLAEHILHHKSGPVYPDK